MGNMGPGDHRRKPAVGRHRAPETSTRWGQDETVILPLYTGREPFSVRHRALLARINMGAAALVIVLVSSAVVWRFVWPGLHHGGNLPAVQTGDTGGGGPLVPGPGDLSSTGMPLDPGASPTTGVTATPHPRASRAVIPYPVPSPTLGSPTCPGVEGSVWHGQPWTAGTTMAASTCGLHGGVEGKGSAVLPVPAPDLVGSPTPDPPRTVSTPRPTTEDPPANGTRPERSAIPSPSPCPVQRERW